MANLEHLNILKQGVVVWNQWRDAKFIEVDLSHSDLRQADLSHANLSHANLRHSDFRNANLTGVNLSEVTLEEADLRQACLNGVCISGTNLDGTNFSGTDLTGLDWHSVDDDVVGVALQNANLSGANLSNAYLRRAELFGANLSQANLSYADLAGAILHRADLNRADLRGVNFRSARLDGANFTEATVGYTTFANVNLATAKGIQTIHHIGPSTIGIDTIYSSRGIIPEIFLRGAGIPDNFIEYMHSLVERPFEFYSCFISFSTKDQGFADRLYADLQRDGVRCWFAPHHVQAGKKLHEQIDSAIRMHERLLLILSPNSINSEWVKSEIAKARKREIKEGKRVLFPIRLSISFEELQEWECFDSDRGKDSACEIREYYIPDFTHWKDHDQYEEELRKLLRDLKKDTDIAAGA